MILIFGFGPGRLEDLGPVVDAICPRCHNPVAFHLWHQRHWFRLFFIPIVPTSSSHFLLCPICRWGRRVEGTGLEMTEAMMGMTEDRDAGAVLRTFGQRQDIDTSTFPWEVVDGVLRRARPS